MVRSADVTTGRIPIACNLSERARTEREHAIVGDIISGVMATHELEDGYAFQFPGDDPWPERIQALVLVERRCCPFFTFELVFEPGHGPIWLRLRGAEGTKAFIEEMFLGRTGNTRQVHAGRKWIEFRHSTLSQKKQSSGIVTTPLILKMSGNPLRMSGSCGAVRVEQLRFILMNPRLRR